MSRVVFVEVNIKRLQDLLTGSPPIPFWGITWALTLNLELWATAWQPLDWSHLFTELLRTQVWGWDRSSFSRVAWFCLYYFVLFCLFVCSVMLTHACSCEVQRLMLAFYLFIVLYFFETGSLSHSTWGLTGWPVNLWWFLLTSFLQALVTEVRPAQLWPECWGPKLRTLSSPNRHCTCWAIPFQSVPG